MRQIEGRNPVLEAIKANSKINKIYIQQDIKDPKIDTIKKSMSFEEVPKQKLDSISKTKRHQGVIALAEEFPKKKLNNFIEGIHNKNQTPLIILLAGVVYEHNLGSVLRSAECFGVNAVVLSKKSFGLSPAVIKSSAGASEYIPVIQMDLHSALKIMHKLGLKIIALSEKSDKLIKDTNLNCPLCIIIGAEDKGINNSLEKYIDEHVKIPMKGKINSLNMATAASVGLYESIKQRAIS